MDFFIVINHFRVQVWVTCHYGDQPIRCLTPTHKWGPQHCWSRDQSSNAPSQWEMSLQCNDVSHWLGALLDWTLHQDPNIVVTESADATASSGVSPSAGILLFTKLALKLGHHWVCRYSGGGGGVNKLIFSVPLFSPNDQNSSYLYDIKFIFGRCHHSWAAETPVKYEHD